MTPEDFAKAWAEIKCKCGKPGCSVTFSDGAGIIRELRALQRGLDRLDGRIREAHRGRIALLRQAHELDLIEWNEKRTEWVTKDTKEPV